MSRVLSAKDLAERGAKRLDGSDLTIIEQKIEEVIEELAQPMVQPVIEQTIHNPIDTTPIASEIGRLVEIVQSALNSQSETIGKLSEKPAHEDFEFTVTERDTQGRIVKIKAQRIANIS